MITGQIETTVELDQYYAKYNSSYSQTSMARTPWNHENKFETGAVRANEC